MSDFLKRLLWVGIIVNILSCISGLEYTGDAEMIENGAKYCHDLKDHKVPIIKDEISQTKGGKCGYYIHCRLVVKKIEADEYSCQKNLIFSKSRNECAPPEEVSSDEHVCGTLEDQAKITTEPTLMTTTEDEPMPFTTTDTVSNELTTETPTETDPIELTTETDPMELTTETDPIELTTETEPTPNTKEPKGECERTSADLHRRENARFYVMQNASQGKWMNGMKAKRACQKVGFQLAKVGSTKTEVVVGRELRKFLQSKEWIDSWCTTRFKCIKKTVPE